MLTHLPEPAWARMDWTPDPQALRPFAGLSEQSWTAAAIAYTKDASAMQELRRKAPAPKPQGKGKAAAKKGNKQNANEEEP